MKEVTVNTQAQYDALPKSFDEYTQIVIKNAGGVRISVVARENSSVVAWGNSSVVAWENSSVVAWENSSVVARENSSVVAWGNSSVVAWENSSVVAWENSSVVARGNSSVVAWGNSSVVAWENSSVVAWENSSVVARGNSSVVARGNSSVVAWENSSVVAWGNSSVVARGNSGVHLQSSLATVVLFSFAVCWALSKGKITKKSKTSTVITPKVGAGINGWADSNGIAVGLKTVLFKRVSKAFATQENTKNETRWPVGATLTHPDWKPVGECGDGKYHACSHAYFCDEFRSTPGDRYVAIEVLKKDLFLVKKPQYPHKISFRKGKVLYECDRMGRKIETKEAK